MPTQYSAEELRDASNKVMKSLNHINSRSERSLAKPAIRNSRGLQDAKISKSSRKRHNRKAKANLAGKPMEGLLDVVPQAREPDPIPLSVKKLEEQRASQAGKRAKHSRRAETKVAQHEIANFGKRSLDEIRSRLLEMNRKVDPDNNATK